MPGEEKAQRITPCPFCGCDDICIEPILGPEAKPLGKGQAHARAKCLRCGAVVLGSADRESDIAADHERAKAEALKNWQTRQSPEDYTETREVESTQWHAERSIEKAKTRIRRAIGAAIETEADPGYLN